MLLNAKVANNGRYTITLSDGAVYEFNWPNVKITALPSREPKYHFRGRVMLRDVRNRLAARITFADSRTAGELKACWGERPGPNDLRVEILKVLEGQEFPLLEGRGNWARYMQFENSLYWRVGDPVNTFAEEPIGGSLPSSALRRGEIELIRQKRYGEADKILEALEASELRDAALRRQKK